MSGIGMPIQMWGELDYEIQLHLEAVGLSEGMEMDSKIKTPIDPGTIPTAFAVATGLLDWGAKDEHGYRIFDKQENYREVGRKVIDELAQYGVRLVRRGDADWELWDHVGIYTQGRFTLLVKTAVRNLMKEPNERGDPS